VKNADNGVAREGGHSQGPARADEEDRFHRRGFKIGCQEVKREITEWRTQEGY